MLRWLANLVANFATLGSGPRHRPYRGRSGPTTDRRQEGEIIDIGRGATDTKPSISGRRISSCMPIQAPKEKPPTQQLAALGLNDCIQSRAPPRRRARLAVVETPLGPSDAAEIEPKRRESAPHEGMVHGINHLVVHGAAMLRLRMQEERDRRIGLFPVMIPAFKPSIRSIENDFWHGIALNSSVNRRVELDRPVWINVKETHFAHGHT